MARPAELQRLLDSHQLRGLALMHAWTAAVDHWVVERWHDVVADESLALVAVGGHGRGQLCPFSDLDLVVLVTPGSDMPPVEKFWYPLWDAGFRVGHAVRTPDEVMAVAAEDLPTATAFLSARLLAGSERLFGEAREPVNAVWSERSGRLRELEASSRERHRSAGDVAFDLEPDLKSGRGGLRDAQCLGWIAEAGVAVPAEVLAGAAHATELLLGIRVELHRVAGQARERLVLQDQDDVAAASGIGTADDLMLAIASSAREVAWDSDEVWASMGVLPSPLGRRRRTVDAATVTPPASIDPQVIDPDDPVATAVVAAQASTTGARLTPDVLRILAATPDLPEPWPAGARRAFVEMLAAGDQVVGVVEALDRFGLMGRLLPEWSHTRSLPQRNAYHRWTVDRHLLETVAIAATLTGQVSRPDLLLLGALLHDIGKGLAGDHSEVGAELAAAALDRMGWSADERDEVVALVRHHLLLPDAATRRDLDDPATARYVTERVGTIDQLWRLRALTEADSRATGPTAWSQWKAGLVDDLVARVASMMAGSEVGQLNRSVLSPDRLALVAEAARLGGPVLQTEDRRVTVACPDRPGLFSEVAGALALGGLDVVAATATSTNGVALDEFQVEPAFDREVRWDRIRHDLELALLGRLALTARLAERSRTYELRLASAQRLEPAVSVINDLSDEATVIEVVGPDSVGLLHRLASALAELHLDILSAKVTTIGPDAIDAFYVRDATGKVVDPIYVREVRRALLHTLTE